MAQALERVDDVRHSQAASRPSRFRKARTTPRIARQGDRSILTVTARNRELSPFRCCGHSDAGRPGQTYVFEHDGAMYESRVSFYNALGALDLTMGAMGSKPQTIVEAAGRRMDSIGARDCFACHSNGGVSGGQTAPGDAAVPASAASRATVRRKSTRRRCARAMRPPRKLPPPGRALRGGDVRVVRPLSSHVVADRAQRTARREQRALPAVPAGQQQVLRRRRPRASAARPATIRTAPLETNLASYDAKCTACHSAALHTKVCRVAKANCAGCHMPKIELPGAHARFTDHQIRIARAGDPYPN